MTPSITEENKDGSNIACEWPTWELTLPEQKPMDLVGEKRMIKTEDVENEEPDNKRLKSSSLQTTTETILNSNEPAVQHPQYNPLNEPSPLGLRLKNSRSLLELIQSKIEEAHIKRTGKDVKARDVVTSQVDKLKASNFPAVRLCIGQWEYVSKYEGDLVAKCYFAKHKLVWEVLDGRLKNKIEIQWGDIVGLQANFPDNGPGILTIMLGKQPLFFRETDPQPRKHTVWQPTTDFTGGEASKYRQHYLQCSHGVLNKHYEKLIQCDTRLNFLSQQVDPLMGLPFAAKDSVEDPNVTNINGYNQLEMSKGAIVSFQKNTGTLDLPHGYVGRLDLVGSNPIVQVNASGPQRTMSVSDVVNHTGHCYSEKKPLQVVDHISHLLLANTRLTAASDDKILATGVVSLSCFLPDGNESNDYSDHNVNNNDVQERHNGKEDDAFTDVLHQLSNITTLPKIFADTPHIEESLASRVDLFSGYLQDGDVSNDYSNHIVENCHIQEWHDGNDSLNSYWDLAPGHETRMPKVDDSFTDF